MNSVPCLFGLVFSLVTASSSLAAPLAPGEAMPTAAAPHAPAAQIIDANMLLPQAFDYYYGVYVNKQKVGWMRSQFVAQNVYIFTVDLHAQVAGMGQVSDIDLHEERRYSSTDRQLESLDFVQSAATGKVQVTGKRKGANFNIDISAGGVTHHDTMVIRESVDDALSTYRLARFAKVGATSAANHFDPSIQKNTRLENKVDAVEKRLFAGVESRAVKITTRYPDLGVQETSWLDNTGKPLESSIGNFFVARLEPPEEAKRLDYQQDLLISAVVKAPRRIDSADTISRLTLTFSGFGEQKPPSSTRQEVTQEGGLTRLVLRRDNEPKHVPLAVVQTDAEALEALRATPFIQSDAPAIIEAAKHAVGNAKDAFTASSRLAAFVYKHIRNEYVPAYSNALEALETARGDCTEHSVLFVALARAVGIPARMAVGIAYWPPGGGFGWHAWGEIFTDGRWIAVDPTWNQPIADATHVKLADGGPAEQARIVMLLGQLQITDMQTK